ncbi:MAG: hypothetical protein M1818_003000 [Claussenomyces sp. TS43310]|nr:MAG: hypothetical protein M1818_003000 [Claussenomyces sp. TS43310]
MTVPTMTMPHMADTSANKNDHIAGYDVNEAFIREAVQQASVGSLRLTILQLTGDKELEEMKVSKEEIRGGALFDYVLSDADQKTVRQKALKYLLQGPRNTPSPPSREESYRLMDLFSDEPMSKNLKEPSFSYEEGYEELAYDDYPREVNWTNGPPAPEELAKFKVIIVGAGISGIAAAIPLKKLGIPFEIIERQGGVGGTWLLNSYPEARVDTLSYLFQYKFEKNYKWSEYFASRGETQKYLDYVATKYGIKEHIKYYREVVAADWDAKTSTWQVQIKHRNDTQPKTLVCNAVISAAGLFSTPNLPDIPGITDFRGPIFHTAQWDHSVDYHNKDIAIIGTGSTGTQLAPGLARTARSLSIYQRTPNWIVKIEGYRNSVNDYMYWLCDNLPYYWNWYCYGAFFRSLHLAALQYYDDDWIAKGGHINRRNDGVRKALTAYMHEKLGDRPDLLEKVAPKHAPLVRRLVVDNGFYDCLKQDNVELVTDDIERITEQGILTKDGKERKYDIIVLGAGFKVSQYLWPVNYVGRDGMTLEKAWKKDGARSYLGLTMPNYPNLFMLYGPNHQPRGGSLYSFGEIWARYAVSSIVGMIERGAKTMEVKQEVFDEYNTRLDDGNKGIIWEMKGSSYYVNEHGRQAVNMPWTTAEYFGMVAKPNFDEFNIS